MLKYESLLLSFRCLWVFPFCLIGLHINADVPIESPIFEDPITIKNTYAPIVPGRLKIMAIKLDSEIIKVDVEIHLQETRTFEWKGNSVPCRIVRTLDFEGGRFSGESYQFFAEANDGSVYFFGEIVTTFLQNGMVLHNGSWLVGGATLSSDPEFTDWREHPTLFMPGNPEIGDIFIREDIPSVMNEINEVLRIGESLSTLGGFYEDTLVIRESSDIFPEVEETKWYAPGIGVVKVHDGDEIGEILASTLEGVVDSLTAVSLWKLIK